jgi:hypothetical protein
MTSGITSGANIIPENKVRPGNRPKRTSVMAASVPSTVATVADITATRIVTHAASLSPSFCRSDPYHFVENPAQTVTSLDSLKL